MTLVPAPRLIGGAAVLAAVSASVLVVPGLGAYVLAADVLFVVAALLDLAVSPRPRRVTAVRFPPARFFVLQTGRVALTIVNQAPVRLVIHVRESVPDGVREPAPEWRGPVPPGGRAEFAYTLTPVRRGRQRWGSIFLRYRTVFGLWEWGKAIASPDELVAYPSLHALDHYKVLALADKTELTDARPIRQLGGSTEFESLRDYVTGDDTRKLDWKATARRNRLIVRQERAERNQSLLILVDGGRLMNAEEAGVSKLDHAVNATMLLAQVALARGDRVGVCAFSHKVHSWLAPRQGLAQGRLIGDTLFDLQGDYRESDPARALQFVSSRHPKRSLVVVITDFVDAANAAGLVAHVGLAARRHVVLLAALKDPFLERATGAPLNAWVDGFRRAAALDLLHDRREVLERIRHLGGLVLDAEPTDLSPRLLNRYLEVSLRGIV